MFNLKARVRARVRSALSQLGLKKNSTTSKMLDCTFIELQAHIAAQFSAGMTWENRNLWEIDHIVPLASAKTESDLIRLSHHTNLQPMWTEDNRRKGAKMPEEWELQNA